jgi:hypothetical protein
MKVDPADFSPGIDARSSTLPSLSIDLDCYHHGHKSSEAGIKYYQTFTLGEPFHQIPIFWLGDSTQYRPLVVVILDRAKFGTHGEVQSKQMTLLDVQRHAAIRDEKRSSYEAGRGGSAELGLVHSTQQTLRALAAW